MSKNLDKIEDILQKDKNITKADYEEIKRLYDKLPLEIGVILSYFKRSPL